MQTFTTHRWPAWEDRSDFLIRAEIVDAPDTFEQLWAKKKAEDTFMVCCIPFFTYDLALGDVVTTSARKGSQYLIEAVKSRSGHQTFRAWIKDSKLNPDSLEEALLASEGVLLEWSSQSLLAIDAENAQIASIVVKTLNDLSRSHGVIYECGFSSD